MKNSNLKKITNTNIQILIKAAKELNIATSLLSFDPLKIEYKYKKNSKEKTFVLGHDLRKLNKNKKAKQISRDKLKTLKRLKKANLPIPSFCFIKSVSEYEKCLKKIPFPQVIKPVTSEKGKLVFLNVKNASEGKSAVLKVLKNYPEGCLVESFLKAGDFRFLVLENKVIGIVQRFPPFVLGDGKHTIKILIDKENKKRFKQNQKQGRRMLNRMRKWDRIDWYLKQQNLSLNSIPEKNKKILLYPLPNFSTGGFVKAIDINKVHKDLKNKAIKAASKIDLTIAGVDMLIKDIKKKAEKNNAKIIEINSDPGLRLHDWPNKGEPQNTAKKVLKFIFKIK